MKEPSRKQKSLEKKGEDTTAGWYYKLNARRSTREVEGGDHRKDRELGGRPGSKHKKRTYYQKWLAKFLCQSAYEKGGR